MQDFGAVEGLLAVFVVQRDGHGRHSVEAVVDGRRAGWSNQAPSAGQGEPLSLFIVTQIHDPSSHH